MIWHLGAPILFLRNPPLHHLHIMPMAFKGPIFRHYELQGIKYLLIPNLTPLKYLHIHCKNSSVINSNDFPF